MKTIHKWQLEITDRQVLKMPCRPMILTVQIQSGILCLWAKVDTDEPTKEYTVLIFGTGNELPVSGWGYGYIGTIQQYGGVWHVFIESA